MLQSTETVEEGVADPSELSEAERAFIELPVEDAFVDSAIQCHGERFGLIVRDDVGERFSGVRQHEDGSLFGLRLGTGVAEVLLRRRWSALAPGLFERLVPEGTDEHCTVMLRDEVHNLRWQPVGTCQFDALGDVFADDRCALVRRQAVVLVVQPDLVSAKYSGLVSFPMSWK
jgi:hypothetical protein